PRARNAEEFRFPFPPWLVFAAKRGEAFSAIFGVLAHELQASFVFRQRRRSDINIEDVPEPQILADTLMHPMFLEGAATLIHGTGAHRKILVPEHAPGADHFDALGLVRVG